MPDPYWSYQQHQHRQASRRAAFWRELRQIGCLIGALMVAVPAVLYWILLCLMKHWKP